MAIDITENRVDKRLRDSDVINYSPVGAGTAGQSSRGSLRS